MRTHFIRRVEKKLAAPLPGRAAHLRMSPSLRRLYKSAPDDAAVAAVLALLYYKDFELHLVLIERQSNNNPNDSHQGQISFPGGKLEEDDASLYDCALREAHEEIGLNVESVQLLGKLTPLYIPVSNFLVHPFVTFAESEPKFKPQASEVKKVLEIPFRFFL